MTFEEICGLQDIVERSEEQTELLDFALNALTDALDAIKDLIPTMPHLEGDFKDIKYEIDSLQRERDELMEQSSRAWQELEEDRLAGLPDPRVFL